jgi:hypothetical protein
MTAPCRQRVALHPVVALFALIPLLAAACSSSSGGDEPCTTCPVPTDAAIRLSLEFDAFSRGLDPAGFRFVDLSRIEVVIEGGTAGRRSLQLTPPQDAAFLDVHSGSYTISATGYQGADLTIFTAAPRTIVVVKGDTANVQLPMIAALGEVLFEVAGQRTGAIQAVAGQDVPFVISVKNTQGRPVPEAAITVASSSGGFGGVLVEGTNDTDAEGRVRGVIRAPHSGIMGGFEVRVDGRPIPVGTGLRVEFASAVDASKSDITGLNKSFLIADDGVDMAEFTVVVQNAEGNPLAGIPITATSSRNAGIDKSVDVIVPLPGFTSGKTDNFGRFSFGVRSTTSSFLEIDAEGRLFSRPDAGRVFHPATIRVIADGIQIDQRDITFNSVANPTGASIIATPQFVPIGQSVSLTVQVRELPQFGGGPAAGVFVEITNAFNVSQNYIRDIRPAPGFSGFRTNAQGEWKGTIRSSVPEVLSLEAKADGRALTHPPRIISFQ